MTPQLLLYEINCVLLDMDGTLLDKYFDDYFWEHLLPEKYAEKKKITFGRALEDRLKVLTTADMAVVVSPGQNEIEQMKELGLDIVSHRKRVNDEPLDEKFKDPADPLSLVFVCAIWLTGFDAPSCSTIYLDKPMCNHSLMQAIARANRVFPEKKSGMIVDYANVFASLEKALAIYGSGQGGVMPVRDKKELVAELRTALTVATEFCAAHGVNLTDIETIPAANFERAGAIAQAADRFMTPENLRRELFAKEGLVNGLLRAVKPDPVANEFSSRCACLRAIAEVVRGTTEPPDISAVMQGIKELLDKSIASDPFRISEESEPYIGAVNLSLIDFEALRKRFEKTQPTNTDVERLKAAVRAQLERMVRLNRTRTDYLTKFQELIESYNNGSRNIEEIFRELLAMSQILSEEQTRHVREHLTDEELTIFDILTRPGPELAAEEREEVKKVARLLLERLKALLVLDWRTRSATRAQVRIQIEDVLDDGLPRAYSKDLYKAKCATLVEHVYESYYGEGKSVYVGAAQG